MNKYKSFIFEKYELDVITGKIDFFYSLDDKISFKDQLILPQAVIFSLKNKTKQNQILQNILFNLHLIIGVTYWKTYCPRNIIINSSQLDEKQAKFWEEVYTNGLGEFYYVNKIDFRGLVSFPFSDKSNSLKKKHDVLKKEKKSLLAFGGGKDSLVSVELLQKNNVDFDLFSLRDSIIQKETTDVVGRPRLIIERNIDPKLFELNKEDAYNGHTPISIFYSFLGVLLAFLGDYQNVIFSNEESASYGNLNYLGMEVNHQYSKSLKSEINFQEYIKDFINPELNIFSLLRPLSELKITEIFSNFSKYFSVFSSCNRNFSFSKKIDNKWCCNCPKCLFVFIMLAAFLEEKEVEHIFSKNLFDLPELKITFLELLGRKNIKPLECVGSVEEVEAALLIICKKKKFFDSHLMKLFKKEIFPGIKNKNQLIEKVLSIKNNFSNIPKEFHKIINNV